MNNIGDTSMDDLRSAGTELRIQRLRDELEASMRSTRRGRLVWWLAGRLPWWRRVLDARLAGLARTLVACGKGRLMRPD